MIKPNIDVIVNDSCCCALSTYRTIVLKCNMIGNDNVLTQDMIETPYTKYVVKYDYVVDPFPFSGTANIDTLKESCCSGKTYYYWRTLISLKKGQSITIPEGCVLLNSNLTAELDIVAADKDIDIYIASEVPGIYNYKIQKALIFPEKSLIQFDGGSISNGTLVGNDTIVITYLSNSDIFNNVITKGNFIYNNNSINILDVPNNISVKDNYSYKLLIVNGQLYIIAVYNDLEKQDASLTWSVENDLAYIGDSFHQFPTLQNPANVSVVYSSSNSNVATIDNNGTITLINTGTTIIKATFTGNNIYNPAEASYTLTVQEQVQELYWSVDGEKVADGYNLSYLVDKSKSADALNTLHAVKIHASNGAAVTVIGSVANNTVANSFAQSHFVIDSGSNLFLPNCCHIGGSLIDYFTYTVTATATIGGSTLTKVLLVTINKADLIFSWEPTSVNITPDREYSSSNPYTLQGTSALLPQLVGADAENSSIIVDKDQSVSSSISVARGSKDTYSVTAIEPTQGSIMAVVNSTQFIRKERKYSITFNAAEPVTPDYYVGWTNTANYDAYESMTPANVAALTLDEGHAGQTYERAYGSDNTFFLLYKGGTASPVVKFISQNTSQDINLTLDNSWIDGNGDYKGDVTIDGTTFKVFADRSPSGYDPTDSMRITLQ